MSASWASVLLQCRRCTAIRNAILDLSVETDPQVCDGMYWPHPIEVMIEVRRVEIAAPGDAA